MQSIDILILSNGPGELATWVQPTVRALRDPSRNWGVDTPNPVRISVILSPCPHANGEEAAMARQLPGVDRVQAVDGFWPFLLWGRTQDNWDWYPRGVVLFLGGDQFFTVLISRRLGYASVTYAEWDARWLSWIDAVGAMNAKVIARVPQRFQSKITVVGDLITEVQQDPSLQDQGPLHDHLHLNSETELIGLLPGSKAAKLTQGVPLLLAIAESVHQQRPQTQFVIPVAPGLSFQQLAQYADPAYNPWIQSFGGVTARLVQELPEEPFSDPTVAPPPALACLETSAGLRISLWSQQPYYGLYRRCQFCLTTVGANTAELGALAVPMIVLIPTQQLDAMRSWDGLPGLLANLPGVGTLFARLINQIAQRYLGLLAWPNIWAGHEIVPELIGPLDPQSVATLALSWLESPQTLEKIRQDLQNLRGESLHPAKNLAAIVQGVLRDR